MSYPARSGILQSSVDHLINRVIPAAHDYNDAEKTLSAVFTAANRDETKCDAACQTAKRRAAEVAIAIDGLADRAARALGITANAVRAQVGDLCVIGGQLRNGCIDRVCAVANAYKHDVLTDPKHPILSDSDVLVVGAGYGIDGFGLGKWGGIEVIVHQKDGEKRKFLADVPYTIAGWVEFLKQHRAPLPTQPVTICGMRVN